MPHQPAYEPELTPGVPALLSVAAGEQLSIRLEQANGIVTLASFDAAGPLARLSMYTTQSMNHSWRLTRGHLLMDTECRPAWTIVNDAQGGLYAGGGYCGRLLDAAHPGPHSSDPTCASVFSAQLTPLGYDERHLGPDTFFTAFVRPEYAPNGHWSVTPCGTAGEMLTLTSAYRQQVTIMVCSHHAQHSTATRGPAATVSVLPAHDPGDRSP